MNVKKVLELPIELTPNCIYLVQDAEFVNIFISSVDGKSAKKVLSIEDVKELIRSLNPDASDIIQFKDDLEILKLEQENIVLLLETLKKLDISYLEEIRSVINNIQLELSNKIEENEIDELNLKIERVKFLINSIDVDYLNSIQSIITNYGIELSDKVSFSDINIIISQINSINNILNGKVDNKTFEELKERIDNIDFNAIQSYQQNLQIIVESLNNKVNINSFEEIQRIVSELYERIDNINNVGLDIVTKDNVQPNLINSIPLYTLDNNGDYVLCKPDIWLEINGYYIPAYKNTTLNI